MSTKDGPVTGDGRRESTAALPQRGSTSAHLTVADSQLALVDSNHHSQIQSLLSCHWTKGQHAATNPGFPVADASPAS